MNQRLTTPQQQKRRKQVITIITVCVISAIITAIWISSAVGKAPGVLATIIATVISVLGFALAILESIGVFEKKQTPTVEPDASTMSTPDNHNILLSPETPQLPPLSDPALIAIPKPALTPTSVSASPSASLSTQEAKPPLSPFPVHPSLKDLDIKLSKDRSAIVVWLDSNSRYSTLSIGHGYDPRPVACRAANVEKHGEKYKVAIFASVIPGPYTLFVKSLRRSRHIYVEPNRIIEIDWTRNSKGAR